MNSSGIAVIVPPRLAYAANAQRMHYPDDAEVIDRLFNYLERTRPLLTDIRASVCEFYCIDQQELPASRYAEFVLARHVFSYLAYRHTRHSLRMIGMWIGNRDHSTVLHGVRRIAKYTVTKPLFADDMDLLRLRISEKMLRRDFSGRA